MLGTVGAGVVFVVVIWISVLLFFGIVIGGDVSALKAPGIAEGSLVVNGGMGISLVICSTVIAVAVALLSLFRRLELLVGVSRLIRPFSLFFVLNVLILKICHAKLF